jgi:hypothetical protein
MSGGGWSPGEMYNNAAGSGAQLSEDANPFRKNGGVFNANTPPESLGSYTQQQYVDPMTLINQLYTKQGPDNSLAPMQAYQQYMKSRK